MPIDVVEVVQGDTDRCPYGFGNFSGRSMVVGGGSAALAARDVARQARSRSAARLFEGEADEVDLRDGVAGGGKTPSVVPRGRGAEAMLTRAFADRRDVEPVAGVDPRLQARQHRPRARRAGPHPAVPDLLHRACTSPWSRWTPRPARSRSLDYVVRPRLRHDDQPGAGRGPDARRDRRWALGGALSEQLAFDADGSLLDDRFKTYLLPRAGDMPSMRIVHQVTPSPFTMHGNKGAGEAGVGGAQAAVVERGRGRAGAVRRRACARCR